MKLRIHSQSIRLRLTVSDVKMLCNHGIVKDQCTIGKYVFKYAVGRGIADKIEAHFSDRELMIMIEPSLVDGWEIDDRVGLENSMKNPDGSTLKIMIEKDFACLDNTTEDQSDNYPNPKVVC